jgi:hypothetical protein
MIVDAGLEHIVNLGTDCSIEPDLCDDDMCTDINCYEHGEGYDDCTYESSLKGYEARLCSKEKNLQANLIKLQSVFNKCKATVNETCGLHVHLDMRQRKPIQTLGNLLDNHKEIRSMVPKHRRLNDQFCEEVDPVEAYNDLVTTIYHRLGHGHKYRDISVDTYRRLKTFEIRIHQGTVDMKAVYNWCAYLIHVADAKPLTSWLKRYVNTTKKSWA